MLLFFWFILIIKRRENEFIKYNLKHQKKIYTNNNFKCVDLH